MTEDEMKAEIARLTKSVEALTGKQEELLTEAKAAKAKARDAEAAKAEAEEAARAKAEEAAAKSGDVDALRKQLEAKHAKEIEKLTGERDGATGQLQKLLIDNGIADALTKANVAPQYARAAGLQFRDGLQIDMRDGAAFVGDKALSDAVSEWVQADGAAFVASSGASGSGASGSGHRAAPGAAPSLGGNREQRIAELKTRMAQ